MSHFLQDVIQLSLLLGLAGNKEGDKIFFRFFSLLYKVLINLHGKIFCIFSSVCNKEERLALKEMKSWDDKVILVQDKGS